MAAEAQQVRPLTLLQSPHYRPTTESNILVRLVAWNESSVPAQGHERADQLERFVIGA
jgi:hypothetical protein